MKKEYEVPFCKVVSVEKKDILTASPTTSDYVSANKKNEQGDYSGGAYIGWNSGQW